MDMELAEDRRSGRREVDVTCYVVRIPSLEVLGERAIEMSPHGMLVVSDTPCEIGETVLVTFDVPGTEETVTMSGRIARLAPGRRADDPGRAFAVELEGLDGTTGRMLREALARYPEAAPRRPARVDYAATASLIALGVDA